jgi:hypothetical protein
MEKVYDDELGEGEGEVVRVVPRTRLGLVTGSATEVMVDEFMEVLLGRADGIVLNRVAREGVYSSTEVVVDEVVLAVLSTGGGL